MKGDTNMDNKESYRRFLKAYWWDEREKCETDQKKGIPAPPVQKTCPRDVPRIALVPPEELKIGFMPVFQAIRDRRSHRKFKADPLTQEELSFLLWAVQGMRGEADERGTKRTVPSAGSRHPLETYLLVNRVVGLEPGVYKYGPLEHELCFLIPDVDLAQKVSEGCRGQTFVGKSPVVFVWTVIPYRAEWRYLMVAPKMIALDAGHVCQNLYIACTAIGAGTCAIGAYDQDKMDVIVGVDGKEEFVIYAAPVGKV